LIPKIKPIFAPLKTNHLMHFWPHILRNKGYITKQFRTGDIAIKLILSCVKLYCSY